MFIPELGTRLQLLEAWKFDLVCESRNKTLWDMKCSPPMGAIQYHNHYDHPVELSIGDTFKVSRIFIRKGSSSFNSVTLTGQVYHLGVIRKCRFWVRLRDFNNVNAGVIDK